METNILVDTHFHLSLEDDIASILKRAKENGVCKFIISGCDLKSIAEGIEIIQKYTNVYLTIGLHPDAINEFDDKTINYLKTLIKTHKKIIGIGEIGLDYYHQKENKEDQKELFKQQLDLATELDLPVVIHTRDAFLDTYEILKKYNLKGIIHCFSGSIENAKRYIDLGYLLGIGGVLTFPNSKLSQTIKEISLSNIVLETDSPYLAPVPHRGTINEPKNILIISKQVADLKNVTLEEVQKQTTSNVKKIYHI